ncbi:M24 family metallopeptidase [Prosthecochloris sp. ZM_2]|uniref:M24 family metallopeptidase n=1 Tax=Prosthecochloris sp. ZM_2 TaxID=2045206 RepID=UPI00351A8BCD
MMDTSWKLDMIRRKLVAEQLDAFFITDLHVIRWLSGFSGSNAGVLLSRDHALLLTDFRYREQVREEVTVLESRIVSEGFAAALKDEHLLCGKRLGIEKERVTLDEAERLGQALNGVELVALKGFFSEFRIIKDDQELELLRQAAAITQKVFEMVLPMIVPGVSEIDIAAEISYQHRRMGAERDSFDPIVACGARAALPHARPTAASFTKGELIVIDMGCMYQGYASDQTRTVSLGRADDDARKVYAIVREAQQLGLDSARPGMPARELDRVVREYIDERGYGKAFGHSLGHGVGTEVHESPAVSRLSHDTLHSSTVFTVEPGIYLPGRFGVRIEDTVIMHETGAEPLQTFTKELVEL